MTFYIVITIQTLSIVLCVVCSICPTPEQNIKSLKYGHPLECLADSSICDCARRSQATTNFDFKYTSFDLSGSNVIRVLLDEASENYSRELSFESKK